MLLAIHWHVEVTRRNRERQRRQDYENLKREKEKSTQNRRARKRRENSTGKGYNAQPGCTSLSPSPEHGGPRTLEKENPDLPICALGSSRDQSPALLRGLLHNLLTSPLGLGGKHLSPLPTW